MKVIVVGGGVIGLSSAIKLLEAGYEVQVWAKELAPHTTSSVAAAIWYPYKIAPENKVAIWCKHSYAIFCDLMELEASGVSMSKGVEFFMHTQSDPEWRTFVHNFRVAQPHELAPGGYAYGYFFDAPLIETWRYMPYLQEHFAKQGGSLIQREVTTLDEVLAESEIVVNCTGLGSYQLVQDTELYPIRGQIVRVAPLTSHDFISAEDSNGTATYIIPRSNDCILGGTAQVGNWSLEPDLATAAQIQTNCAILLPEVASVPVLGHLVGLRPGRKEVRLEALPQPDGKLLIHNYGHGGAGVTVSWGCAEEVLSLVKQK
jgi:D-amino-acid oxidase